LPRNIFHLNGKLYGFNVMVVVTRRGALQDSDNLGKRTSCLPDVFVQDKSLQGRVSRNVRSNKNDAKNKFRQAFGARRNYMEFKVVERRPSNIRAFSL
jgi:hypothetical protein